MYSRLFISLRANTLLCCAVCYCITAHFYFVLRTRVFFVAQYALVYLVARTRTCVLASHRWHASACTWDTRKGFYFSFFSLLYNTRGPIDCTRRMRRTSATHVCHAPLQLPHMALAACVTSFPSYTPRACAIAALFDLPCHGPPPAPPPPPQRFRRRGHPILPYSMNLHGFLLCDCPEDQLKTLLRSSRPLFARRLAAGVFTRAPRAPITAPSFALAGLGVYAPRLLPVRPPQATRRSPD